MSKGRKREKTMILTARVLSMLFTPFYLPLVGMMALFLSIQNTAQHPILAMMVYMIISAS